MYIHVFNSCRYPRLRYTDVPDTPVTIREVTDVDGVSVLSVVPADDTPVCASDVNLKAKLSVGAPLMPMASIQPSNLSLADASQNVLANVKLPNS